MKAVDVENAVLSNFGYLITEYGFGMPDVTRRNTSTVVKYRMTRVGIDVEIEFMDSWVYVLAVRLISGAEPDGYYSHRGRTARVHIERILQRFGLVERERLERLKKAAAKSKNVTHLPALIEELASLTKIVTPHILQDLDRVFDSFPTRDI